MREELALRALGWLALADAVGKTRWDLGLVFRPDLLVCTDPGLAISRHNREIVCAARSVVARTADIEFRLYLLHWRSRLRGARDHREEAALALRTSIRRDLENDVPVVVLGDFNEEPFDAPLTRLNTSRDPRRVLRDRNTYLYNPSWCFAAPGHAEPWGAFGSFRRASGKTSQSYLYDQALTSAHFLDEQRRIAPVFRVMGADASPAGTVWANLDHTPIELTLP
jgi:hypothetical protein